MTGVCVCLLEGKSEYSESSLFFIHSLLECRILKAVILKSSTCFVVPGSGASNSVLEILFQTCIALLICLFSFLFIHFHFLFIHFNWPLVSSAAKKKKGQSFFLVFATGFPSSFGSNSIKTVLKTGTQHFRFYCFRWRIANFFLFEHVDLASFIWFLIFSLSLSFSSSSQKIFFFIPGHSWIYSCLKCCLNAWWRKTDIKEQSSLKAILNQFRLTVLQFAAIFLLGCQTFILMNR